MGRGGAVWGVVGQTWAWAWWVGRMERARTAKGEPGTSFFPLQQPSSEQQPGSRRSSHGGRLRNFAIPIAIQ